MVSASSVIVCQSVLRLHSIGCIGCDYGEWIQKNMTRDIMVHVLPSSVFAMSLQQENTMLATSGNVNALPQKHSGILKTNLVESSTA